MHPRRFILALVFAFPAVAVHNHSIVKSCTREIQIHGRSNVPSFHMGTGKEVNVKINRIEKNDIFYTLTVKGVSRDGKFMKLE